MNATFRSIAGRFLVSSLVALFAATCCLAIEPMARIQNPTWGSNVKNGTSVTVSGNMWSGQHLVVAAWVVDYPSIRVELWFPGDYLLGAAETGINYVQNTPNGAWSTSMTFNQIGEEVAPYFVVAIPLTPLNEKYYNGQDDIVVAIVSGS